MFKKYLRVLFVFFIVFSNQLPAAATEVPVDPEVPFSIPGTLRTKLLGYGKKQRNEFNAEIGEFLRNNRERSFSALKDALAKESIDLQKTNKRISDWINAQLTEFETRRVRSYEECVSHFRQHIAGQEDVIATLSCAVHRFSSTMNGDIDHQPNVIFLTGPSGSGKTSIYDALKALLPNVPGMFISGTDLTPEGYVGKNLITSIEELYKPHQGKYVILWLDELDKILGKGSFTGAIQNSLLPMFGGDGVRNKFFILATGAFSKFRETYCGEMNKHALVNAGFSTEFVGRVHYVLNLQALSLQALRQILDLKTSPLKKCQTYLSKTLGKSVFFAEESLNAIAFACVSSPYGARSLNDIFRQIEDNFVRHTISSDITITLAMVQPIIDTFTQQHLPKKHTNSFSSISSSSSINSLTTATDEY
jgi:ATP-dependent protease Clp ATPase subunit